MTDWETRMGQRAAEQRAMQVLEPEEMPEVRRLTISTPGNATTALDLSTIAHCLQVLETELPGPLDWRPVNDDQERFLTWLAANRDELRRLTGLEGKASTDYAVLNDLLVRHGFEPKFQPFDGVGVASILDMLVNWLHVGEAEPITRDGKEYPGFELGADDFSAYQVQGFDGLLAQLKTATGHSLWMIMAEPLGGLDLAMTAQRLAAAPKQLDYQYRFLRMPKLDISTEPDLDWLLGARTEDTESVPWYVEQAFQMFKLRLNEKGARVKVATGMAVAVVAAGPWVDPTLVFDQPFIGYFTQPGLDDVATAAFYADTDSWQEPSGLLDYNEFDR